MEDKHAIISVDHTPGEYISSYFAVPKPRSTKFRPILNLKRFNKSIKKYCFKMETLALIREWIKENAFCVRMDLKDAFLHVPISDKFHHFLRFSWLGKLYQWGLFSPLASNAVLGFLLKYSNQSCLF